MSLYSFPSRTRGFTLAELLIALVVLAVIATFAIPKVLQSEQDARKRAIFKEVLSSVYGLYEQAQLDGTISDPSNYQTQFVDYLIANLNIVKYQRNDAHNASFIFASGARLSINAYGRIDVIVDYNGSSVGNNSAGDDIIVAYINWTASCGQSANRMEPYSPTCGGTGYGDSVANERLFYQVFN